MISIQIKLCLYVTKIWIYFFVFKRNFTSYINNRHVFLIVSIYLTIYTLWAAEMHSTSSCFMSSHFELVDVFNVLVLLLLLYKLVCVFLKHFLLMLVPNWKFSLMIISVSIFNIWPNNFSLCFLISSVIDDTMTFVLISSLDIVNRRIPEIE